MKRFVQIIFIPVLFSMLLTTSCHETETFDGPNLVDRFGDFFVITSLAASRATVDFSVGETVVFTASFNKSVDWVLEITGMESGAVKRITGFDNELDAGNATWSGGVTELPFFKMEMCSIELLIPDEDSPEMTAEVEITGTKNYEGNLFADFEEDAGSSIFFGNFEFELAAGTGRRMADPDAAQGNWYYYFTGTDNVVSNFFVGLIRIFPSIIGETYLPVPTSVPEELYFNSFIYADGGPHGIAVIQFVTDTNGNGTWDDGVDLSFQLPGDYTLDWEGWRHINHTMAELGMSESQLEKIVMVQVLLISNKNSQPTPPLPVDFGIDFMTFTAGAPLQL